MIQSPLEHLFLASRQRPRVAKFGDDSVAQVAYFRLVEKLVILSHDPARADIQYLKLKFKYQLAGSAPKSQSFSLKV